MSVNIIRLRYLRNMEPIDPPMSHAIRSMTEWICGHREELKREKTRVCPDCHMPKPISEFTGVLKKERKRCQACTEANYRYIKRSRERHSNEKA